MGWFRKKFGKVASKATGAFLGATLTAPNAVINAAGGKGYSLGRDDVANNAINKNARVLRDIGKAAVIVGAGIATGGVLAGSAAGATLGGALGVGAAGINQKRVTDTRVAEREAREAAEKLKAGAVAPQAGEGATQTAKVGEEIAVVDPVEEAARKARAKNSKRVLGSVIGTDDKLGSTAKLGAGI